MPNRIPTGRRLSVVNVEIPQAPARRGRSGGDYVDAFVPSGGPWKVAIAELGSNEHIVSGGTSIGAATHTVTGPYRSDVTIHARLRRGQTAFAPASILNVVAVDFFDQRRGEIVARCREVIP
jgi:head-tail adaptor